MFESIINFFKNLMKKENKTKDTARERLQLVLMQDRASVSADYLDLMKQEIIEVIKKYINIDENALQVELTKPKNKDGTYGAPSLYANIPILGIKTEHKPKEEKNTIESTDKKQENKSQNNTNKKDNEDKKENQNKDELKSENETIEKLGKENTKEDELSKKIEEKNNDSSKNNKQTNNKNNSKNVSGKKNNKQ